MRTTRPPTRRTMTIPEFATELGIDRSTAYSLAKANRLPVPTIRVGRRLLLARDAVDRLLSGEPTKSEPPSGTS